MSLVERIEFLKKMQPDFEVAKNNPETGKPSTRHKINELSFQTEKIQHRQQLDCELILELDNPTKEENEKAAKEIFEILQAHGFVGEWFSGGTKSIHGHYFFEKKITIAEREEFVDLLLLQFKPVLDKAFWTDKSHLIAIENAPHYKTGKEKVLLFGGKKINNSPNLSPTRCKICNYALLTKLPSGNRNHDLAPNFRALNPSKDLIKRMAKVQGMKESDFWEGEKTKFNCKHLQKEFPFLAGFCKDCNKQKQTEKEGTKIVPMLEKDGILYEVVFDGENSSFIWLENNEAKTAEKLVLNGIEYSPCCTDAVTKGAVLLPKKTMEYESEKALLEEIQQFIHKYLDVSPDYEIFASYYVLLSWIQDKLTTVPYLRFLGDFSTGKSRGLDVTGKICYKPIISAGTITPAPLYRLQGFWHGTVLIDEGDRKRSDTADEITKILNCGFEKGKPVLRCNDKDPNDIEIHDPFGCKVIASRYDFYDLALESRCLTERMRETNRNDIPTVLPKEFFEEQEILQEKLLLFRLRNRDKINVDAIQEFKIEFAEKRLQQAVSGFAVLFSNNPPLLEKFKKFAIEYQKQLIEAREESFDGKIINFLLDCAPEEGTKEITAEKIALEILPNEKGGAARIGKQLRALGLETKPKRIGEQNKTIRELVWNAPLLEKLFKKYNAKYWLTHQKQNVTGVTEVTAVTGSGQEEKNQDPFKEETIKKQNLADTVSSVTTVTAVTKQCRHCSKETDCILVNGIWACSSCAQIIETCD